MGQIKTTMPGVFYRRPAPDAAPYVEEGAHIAPGQTVALIEVMKTFNEIKADATGVLRSFLLDDGDEVAMGQALAEVDEA